MQMEKLRTSVAFLAASVTPVLDVLDPRFTAVQVLDDERVLAVELGELGLEVSDDERVHLLGRLGRHETARKLLYKQNH